MSKVGLKGAYKKLTEILGRNDSIDWDNLNTRSDYEVYVEHCLYSDDEPPADFMTWLEYEEREFDNDKYEEDSKKIEESNELVKMALKAAKTRFVDREEQLKFAINALSTTDVILSTEALDDILSILPENSKLDEIKGQNMIAPGEFEDIWDEDLGSMFKKVGKSIDELPDGVLMDSEFMKGYLTARVSNEPDYSNNKFVDSDLTYGEIVDRAISLCDEKERRDR